MLLNSHPLHVLWVGEDAVGLHDSRAYAVGTQWGEERKRGHKRFSIHARTACVRGSKRFLCGAPPSGVGWCGVDCVLVLER